MEFCKRQKLLHVLPERGGRRIAWSWRTENGTMIRIAGRDRSADCRIEVLNVLLPLIAVLLASIVCLRQKCGKRRGESSGGRLPFHTTRTLFCISLLLILFLEISESLLTTVSLSSIFTIFAVFSCWILHRSTEIGGSDSGIAFTAAIFAAIGLARACKSIYLSSYGLTIEHVRLATASSSAILCGFFAVLDSYALYLTTRRKRRYLNGQEADGPRIVYRHSEASFVGRISFHWVVGLLSKGYKTPLECQDLGQLPADESAARQFEKFKAILDGERENGQLSLWRCFWKRVWFPFAVGGLLKLLGDAAALVGPMTISKILDYVSAAQNGTTDHRTYRSAITFPEILDNGYFLALLAFVFALLQSTLSQASTHVLCVEGIRLKTAIQALLYDKALRLSSWSIDEDSEKDREKQRSQQTADTGTLTNLVSEDAYNVMSFFWIGHYTWAIPLKIAVIVFLLYAKLGISAVIGALCCILLVTPMQLILGKKMSENFKSVTSRSDARLRLVNEVLQGMKLVKLRAWEDVFEQKIAKTRDEELEMLDKDSLYWALINFLSHASSVLTTLFTFGAYHWIEDRKLEAGDVFAGLALFSQLTVPLLIFPVTIPIVINAMVSATRMEDFLRLPDMENVLPDLGNRKSEAGDDASSGTDPVDETTVAPTKLHSDATYGSLGSIQEDEEDRVSCGSRDCRCRVDVDVGVGVDVDSSADTVFEKDTEIPVLRIKECAFSVRGSEEGQPSMLIEELDLPRGQLTLVVGKTGSGKTSLLLGMLGEIQRTSGSIEWSQGSKIAYVAQRPWLLNATLRDNILFGSAYKPRRYRSVLKACALRADVDILPGQDLTRIGENGINLSGGQKQRVAIARAIYSDADVAIMDDPLSALDPQVGQQIFDQGIRKLLLRTGRTVIMVTHRLDLLSTAHRVIVMEDCRVRASGVKSAIEESDPKLASEWRKAATRQRDRRNTQRIAKDRWSLLRLVTRIGINANNGKASDGSWIVGQDAHVNPPSFVPLRIRRTALSGSTYLTPDLADLPIPTDEWNVADNQSKFHRHATRSISLQPQRRPPPVLRQSSTPTILETGSIADRKRNNTFDNGQTNGVLRQIFSGRSNQVREQDHLPAKRLLSVESKGTENNDTEETGNYDTEDHESYEDKCGMVTRTICVDYLKAGGWIPGLIYTVVAILCQILRVYTDLWLGRWTDQERETLAPGEDNTWFYFRVYIALSVGSILLCFACNAVGQWTGARARRQLHEEAISRLLRVPLSFFECNPVGKILSRFSADMGVVDKKLSTSIQRLIFFVLLCGSAITVNVIVSPWFLVAALPICAIYYLVQRFYRRSARHLQRLDGSTRWPIATHFSETLAGLATLRASKQENRFMDQATKCLDINTNAFLLLNASNRWLGIALDYLGAVIVVAATFAALISAELYPSRVTPALVGLAINYTLLVPIYLNWVVKFTAEIEMYMGSVARISAYRHADSEDYQDEDGYRVPDIWPNRGEIIFDNVSLIYHAQKEPVISDLTLKIPAGQKIGVCGRTGSGKSSAMMALFRLVEVARGRILIDGVDVRRLPLRTLRSRISAIPQDSIMFGGTIRENLDPLCEHNDRELWNALEVAQIKDVVASHPEGLDFEVREGGENFSSGQLQLLCTARAILRKSSIVVLDEATSGLDAATEKSLLKTVSATFEDRTVIVIAHRPAALLDCDRIIVFHEGKIVEEGSPIDLSGRPGGFFANMVKSNDENEDTVR